MYPDETDSASEEEEERPVTRVCRSDSACLSPDVAASYDVFRVENFSATALKEVFFSSFSAFSYPGTFQ